MCTVMAQLTEDIQPSFETTLKSKAVSENCNVKFTCVVSGYPAPELKWYKDDMEMDRYCGLPKYEIHRNGKTHTLHIYNCTLDDAAIYQVSASNSKGIVSCSGVLEVGPMSEYQIHQRFFAKLKEKAEKKKRDLEEQTKKNSKEGKENIQKEDAQRSPERTQRKRPIPGQSPAVHVPEDVEPLGPTAESNKVSNDVQETAMVPAIESDLKKETEEALAKKKIKMSNGLDAESAQSGVHSNSSWSHTTGNGGENHYDGGVGLAQFLSETLQSQAAEEKHGSSREEKAKDTDSGKERDNEEESKEKVEEKVEDQGKLQQEVFEKERQKKREHVKERQENAHTTPHKRQEPKHHSKSHKDHKDHKDHNIQVSISSMLHSVKDFFFGKNKKDSHEHPEHSQRESDISSQRESDLFSKHSPAQQTPVSFWLQSETKPKPSDIVPMEVEQSQEPLTVVEHSQVLAEQRGDTVQDLPAPESAAECTGRGVEPMEVTAGAGVNPPSHEAPLSNLQLLTEVVEKDNQTLINNPIFFNQHDEPGKSVVVPQQAEGDEISALPQTQPLCEQKPSVSVAHNWLPPFSHISPAINSHSTCAATTESLLREQEMSADKTTTECEPEHSQASVEPEKAEVKSHTDIKTSGRSELATPLQEDEKASCEPNQVLLLPPARETNTEENTEEETVCTVAVNQEMNLELLPTEVLDTSQKSHLQMQREHMPYLEEESTDGINVQSSEGRKEKNTEKDVKEMPCDETSGSQDTEAQTIQQEPEKIVASEPSTSILVSQNVSANCVVEVQINVPDQEAIKNVPKIQISAIEDTQDIDLFNQTQKSSTGNMQDIKTPPQFQISTAEDIPDIKAVVPVIQLVEHIITPHIVIIEPEVRECPSPLSNVADSEPIHLQKNQSTDESKVMVQDHNMADSFSLCPTQLGTRHDLDMSSTERVKEVAQSDETKTLEQVDVKSREQLPQTDYSVPVINVSCTEDKEQTEMNGQVSDPSLSFETAVLPLFVVPPIAVTCHESEPDGRVPPQSDKTETETPATALGETRQNADSHMSEKCQSTKQNQDEMSENKPSVLNEAPNVDHSVLALSKKVEDSIESEITKSLKEARIESFITVERLSFKPPVYPSLSPNSLRKFMSKQPSDSDTAGDRQSDKADDDVSGGSTPTSSLSCESSPRLKRRDSLSLIRSATPEELASGARRKIFIPKPKEDSEGTVDTQSKKEAPYMSPSQARRGALLQTTSGQSTPPMERRSPLLNRRKATLEVPKVVEESPTPEPVSTKRDEKSSDKRPDPLKAPQVIRKIRGEPFPDASGHLKLWCQFFNVLCDSTIKWYKEEEEILEVKRSGGDESQVALAIVLASSQDCGVYGCTIKNEYGTDTTDFLLSEDVMSEILLKDDLEVGEEIEMTPLLFNRGLADSGNWGAKFFGRIMTETVHMGQGWAHKTCRAKVIYGLDPIFESGRFCIMKVQNPIAYGTKQESNLAEKNQEITKQECRVQNMIREYCKIFAAEARVNECFGCALEVIPQYLMYRPANSVPYATVELDLQGDFQTYCMVEPKGKLITKTASEVEQKCCVFQHWIHEWTHGNLLVTRLEGVDFKLTNIRVVTKSKGYQGLSESSSPEVFEQFITHHQCNYYCGLLGLRPLKTIDSLQQPGKMKGSRSPLLNRKLSTGSSSPHLQKKGSHSPHSQRKASPKVPRKAQETEEDETNGKVKSVETAFEMR